MQVETAVFVSYYKNHPGTFPSFYLVGIRPFGLQSTAIEIKTHFSAESAMEDYRGRLCR